MKLNNKYLSYCFIQSIHEAISSTTRTTSKKKKYDVSPVNGGKWKKSQWLTRFQTNRLVIVCWNQRKGNDAVNLPLKSYDFTPSDYFTRNDLKPLHWIDQKEPAKDFKLWILFMCQNNAKTSRMFKNNLSLKKLQKIYLYCLTGFATWQIHLKPSGNILTQTGLNRFSFIICIIVFVLPFTTYQYKNAHK